MLEDNYVAFRTAIDDDGTLVLYRRVEKRWSRVPLLRHFLKGSAFEHETAPPGSSVSFRRVLDSSLSLSDAPSTVAENELTRQWQNGVRRFSHLCRQTTKKRTHEDKDVPEMWNVGFETTYLLGDEAGSESVVAINVNLFWFALSTLDLPRRLDWSGETFLAITPRLAAPKMAFWNYGERAVSVIFSGGSDRRRNARVPDAMASKTVAVPFPRLRLYYSVDRLTSASLERDWEMPVALCGSSVSQFLSLPKNEWRDGSAPARDANSDSSFSIRGIDATALVVYGEADAERITKGEGRDKKHTTHPFFDDPVLFKDVWFAATYREYNRPSFYKGKSVFLCLVDVEARSQKPLLLEGGVFNGHWRTDDWGVPERALLAGNGLPDAVATDLWTNPVAWTITTKDGRRTTTPSSYYRYLVSLSQKYVARSFRTLGLAVYNSEGIFLRDLSVFFRDTARYAYHKTLHPTRASLPLALFSARCDRVVVKGIDDRRCLVTLLGDCRAAFVLDGKTKFRRATSVYDSVDARRILANLATPVAFSHVSVRNPFDTRTDAGTSFPIFAFLTLVPEGEYSVSVAYGPSTNNVVLPPIKELLIRWRKTTTLDDILGEAEADQESWNSLVLGRAFVSLKSFLEGLSPARTVITLKISNLGGTRTPVSVSVS